MRLIFLGSPSFAVPALRALHGGGHELALVVTRPDRPRGRHGTPQPTAVKRAALELDLRIYQPESVNLPEAVEMVSMIQADMGVTIAYGELLCPPLLAATRRGFLNVHASLLPRYRGAAPINWAIIRGETVTGVSVIRMSPELDTGPVLADRQVEIGPQETAGQLQERLAGVGAALLLDVVDRLAAGKEVPDRVQSARRGFFARRLTKQDGRIDWAQPAAQIANRVRGVTPWPGAYSDLRCADKTLRVALLCLQAEAGPHAADQPGQVLAADQDGLLVGTSDGAVRIRRLRPSGKRAMDAEDFVRGYRVRVGDRFL